MNRKICCIILIVAIIVQLAVPVGMIISKSEASKNFEKECVEIVIPIEIYWASSERLFYGVKYSNEADYNIHNYFVVDKDDDGSCQLTCSKKKPKDKDYIKISEFISGENRFFDCGDFDSDDLAYYFNYDISSANSTAKFKLYKGEVKIVDIYIDGVQINEWYDNIKQSSTK